MLREIKEEVGLDVQIMKLRGVYSKPDQNDLAFSFVCRITGGELTLTDEADQIEYFAVDNLPPNTLVRQVERIKDVVPRNNLVMKIQAGPST